MVWQPMGFHCLLPSNDNPVWGFLVLLNCQYHTSGYSLNNERVWFKWFSPIFVWTWHWMDMNCSHSKGNNKNNATSNSNCNVEDCGFIHRRICFSVIWKYSFNKYFPVVRKKNIFGKGERDGIVFFESPTIIIIILTKIDCILLSNN